MSDRSSAHLGDLLRVRRQELGLTREQHVELLNRRLRDLDPSHTPLTAQKLYRREAGIASFKWAEVVAAFEAVDLRMVFLEKGSLRPLPPHQQVHAVDDSRPGKRAAMLASLLLEQIQGLDDSGSR